jgi:uncharacterized tellurite resistance protein B-like protein
MFEQIVHWLAYGSLAIGAASAYLHLNKLWSRKHIPEVAASISISGTVLEAIPTTIFGVYFMTNRDPVGVIDSAIWLLSAVGFLMIGSGFWVLGQRKMGFWQLAWRSIRFERQEVGNLAQSVLQPASREQLIALLQRLAEVDGVVSEEEADLVNQVAESLNLDANIKPHRVADNRVGRLLSIRNALRHYLITSPPKASVEKLEHLLVQLAAADGNTNEDEQFALDEVNGLIRDYLQDDSSSAAFRVLLAPQSQDQISRISTILSESPLHETAGGRGVTVGEFHTREYADSICKEYRELGFFCVVTDEVLA